MKVTKMTKTATDSSNDTLSRFLKFYSKYELLDGLVNTVAF